MLEIASFRVIATYTIHFRDRLSLVLPPLPFVFDVGSIWLSSVWHRTVLSLMDDGGFFIPFPGFPRFLKGFLLSSHDVLLPYRE